MKTVPLSGRCHVLSANKKLLGCRGALGEPSGQRAALAEDAAHERAEGGDAQHAAQLHQKDQGHVLMWGYTTTTQGGLQRELVGVRMVCWNDLTLKSEHERLSRCEYTLTR